MRGVLGSALFVALLGVPLLQANGGDQDRELANDAQAFAVMATERLRSMSSPFREAAQDNALNDREQRKMNAVAGLIDLCARDMLERVGRVAGDYMRVVRQSPAQVDEVRSALRRALTDCRREAIRYLYPFIDLRGALIERVVGERWAIRAEALLAAVQHLDEIIAFTWGLVASLERLLGQMRIIEAPHVETLLWELGVLELMEQANVRAPEEQVLERALMEDCSICLEVLRGTEIVISPCGHVFHRACLQDWFGRDRSCPICREAIPPALFH